MNTRQPNESEIQSQAILNARLAIERKFSEIYSLEPRLSRLTLNEAEALAWQSGVPHLVFPLLAEEKVKALATWRANQASMRRIQPGIEFGARWQSRASGSTRRRLRFSSMVPPGSRRLT